jgi:transposase-like protein
MCTVPEPHPKEVRDDVVRVARNGEPGQHLKQIASDFGISESCLTGWLKAADVGPPVHDDHVQRTSPPPPPSGCG